MDNKTRGFSFFNLPGRLTEVEDKVAELEQEAGGAVAWADISGKPATFLPTIGTTATTAKAGNYQPTWAQVTGKPTTFEPIIGTTATTAKAGNYVPTWAEVTGKPATFTPTIGVTSTTAKAGDYTPSVADIPALPTSKITSGTFAIAQLPTGTSASTVALGNHNHAITADAASGLSAAANLQALAVALSARIKALEDAAV